MCCSRQRAGLDLRQQRAGLDNVLGLIRSISRGGRRPRTPGTAWWPADNGGGHGQLIVHDRRVTVAATLETDNCSGCRKPVQAAAADRDCAADA